MSAIPGARFRSRTLSSGLPLICSTLHRARNGDASQIPLRARNSPSRSVPGAIIRRFRQFIYDIPHPGTCFRHVFLSEHPEGRLLGNRGSIGSVSTFGRRLLPGNSLHNYVQYRYHSVTQNQPQTPLRPVPEASHVEYHRICARLACFQLRSSRLRTLRVDYDYINYPLAEMSSVLEVLRLLDTLPALEELSLVRCFQGTDDISDLQVHLPRLERLRLFSFCDSCIALVRHLIIPPETHISLDFINDADPDEVAAAMAITLPQTVRVCAIRLEAHYILLWTAVEGMPYHTARHLALFVSPEEEAMTEMLVPIREALARSNMNTLSLHQPASSSM